jgi:hypothetical protein
MTLRTTGVGWSQSPSGSGRSPDVVESEQKRKPRPAIIGEEHARLGEAFEVWLNAGLFELSETDNLDRQDPATLYFLGQIRSIEQIEEVYVERKENGEKKHWVILGERDYDAMDRIYEIEQDTMSRFPASDLDFRVSLRQGSGPSVQAHAVKVYDKK